MPVKIVLCGPPGTGKSCLREGLKRAILALGLDYPYPYCLPANPDGDGAYFLPTYWNHPNEAAQWRQRIRDSFPARPFSEEFIALTAKQVRECALPLVFIDIGGKPWADNLEICRGATHAVILWKDPGDLEPWLEFCANAKLRVIAEIQSDYRAEGDVVHASDSKGVLRGTVHRLDRGESAEGRPMVRALAEHVLRLTGTKPSGGSAQSAFLLTPGASSRDTLMVSAAFGRPASGPEIARAAVDALGPVMALPAEFRTLLVDGPISVMAAAAVAWKASSRFAAIGFFDPKLNHFAIVHAKKDEAFSDWTPEPGAVIDFGPVPTPPRGRPGREDSAAVFTVNAAEKQGDGRRVVIGPGKTPAPAFEMIPAALDQLAAIPADAAGVLFDGRTPVVVAAALACAAMERFQWVAFLDPREKRFVVAASKSDTIPIGLQL